ncbi:MAG: winged helix-turn-helix transcriptional regulator [Candidatus Saccharibacteria bacterium]|nr:winged helix-turn-helix transcriptional regulator [Microbacteriaceae bacterium]
MTYETQTTDTPHHGSWPQWKQIANDLEADIRYGTLQPGTRLPSIRARAIELDVSDVKVQYAYRSLAKRSLVVSQGRAGTRVCVDAASPDEVRQLARHLSELAIHAGLDLQALEGTIRGAWRQLRSDALEGGNDARSYLVDPATAESDMTVFGQDVSLEGGVMDERHRQWGEDSKVDAEDDFS